MVRLAAILVATLCSGLVYASPFRGYVAVGDGRELFVRYLHKSKQRKTIVLLNGLTQDTDHWGRVAKELHHYDFNILIYDAFLQGRSLERFVDRNHLKAQIGLKPVLPPLLGYEVFWPLRGSLLPATPIEQQAQDLLKLMDQLRIQEPVALMGLSYGGGLALEVAAQAPQRVSHAFLVAPYVAPLPAQDRLIRQLLPYVRPLYPLYTEDDVYDFLLRGLVLNSYHYSEPSILNWGPFQIFAAAELVRGIRPMDTVARANSLVGTGVKLHLVKAGRDAYLPPEMVNHFWERVSPIVRSTRVTVDNVEHKVNESVGTWLGEWVHRVVDVGDIPEGRSLHADPVRGVVVDPLGGWKTTMKKVVMPCENLLVAKLPGGASLPVDQILRNPYSEWVKRVRPYLPQPVRVWLDAWWKDPLGF